MESLYIKIIVGAVICINAAAFLAYGADKKRAQKNRWRVPEETLFLLAAFGGAAGALLGMHIFRHKTQKALFKIGVPCMLILQIAALGLAAKYMLGRIW